MRRMPLPPPFRWVYRDFDWIDFDPIKSDEVFAERGFDLAHVARAFPGYVLERQDVRRYREIRYQAIAEVLGELYFLVYTLRGRGCRLITAWVADRYERQIWHEASR
jgi:uncharacterized DUF497 family protein